MNPKGSSTLLKNHSFSNQLMDGHGLQNACIFIIAFQDKQIKMEGVDYPILIYKINGYVNSLYPSHASLWKLEHYTNASISRILCEIHLSGN